MLVEAIKVLENVVMFGAIAVLIWIVLMLIKESTYTRSNSAKNFKALLCLGISILVMISTLIFSAFCIYQVGIMVQTYEFTEGEVVSDWIKEIFYLATETFILFVGSMCIIYLWEIIFLKQIVPGDGNLKTRIRNYLRFERQ